MFPYKKLALAAIVVLLGVPSVSMAGSFVTSVMQGKSPAEAIQIIAEQIDLLTGRVATLETKQSDTELEIERLKLENEDLRFKTDEALTGTAKTRANEARNSQCAELAAQIRTKEDAVRAPFEARIEPLQEELRTMSAKMQEEQKTSAATEGNDIEAYQARIEAFKAARAEIDAKREEIDVISEEMEKALDTLHQRPEVKVVQDELDKLLCA